MNLIEALLETLSSEHCGYGHTRDLVERLLASAPRSSLDAGGNAGWTRFDDEFDLALKMESHNHPSAVKPFEGAATGVGGIIRDILATGAHPFALADGLALGRDAKANDAIADGIGHYANTVGLPTIAGETRSSAAFDGAPLVNVMCVGYARRGERVRRLKPGDRLVLVGARTDASGLGGAVFASRLLDDESRSGAPVAFGEEEGTPLQTADAFRGHMLTRFVNSLPKSDIAMTDLGAGGLGVAASEMARRSGCGIDLDLALVPVISDEIPLLARLLSETQERMLVGCEEPEGILSLAARHGLDAAVVGGATEEGIRFREGGKLLGELPLFTVPLRRGRAEFVPEMIPPDEKIDSKNIYTRYDWSVGGRTVLPPGEGACGVIHPRALSSPVALALVSNRLPVKIERPDEIRDSVVTAFQGAVERIHKAGAIPLAATNGVNVGDPESLFGAFALEGIFEGLEKGRESTGVPMVSGNVSCYNLGVHGGIAKSIPPTVYIGIVGKLLKA